MSCHSTMLGDRDGVLTVCFAPVMGFTDQEEWLKRQKKMTGGKRKKVVGGKKDKNV